MKKISLIFASVLIVSCFFVSQSTLAKDEWKQVWEEEFNYTGLPNPAFWSYEVGFVRNQEKQYYTKARDKNVRVEDGHLIIESHKEDYEGANYTSGSIHTWNKQHFKYGRIEVKAKLPTGFGTWPAIWMLGTNRDKVGWPECGEIDIMENVGFNPDVIHANIHTDKYNHAEGTGKGDQIEVEAPYNQFYIYAVEWSPVKIDFFIDDQKYFTYENEGTGEAAWPFDQDFYLILNTAIGGTWGGKEGIDDSIFPQQYLIDYVRYYQKANSVDQ